MPNKSEQQTFGSSTVRRYYGRFTCSKFKLDDNGVDNCDNDAIIIVDQNGNRKRFCKKHSRKAWLEMVGL